MPQRFSLLRATILLLSGFLIGFAVAYARIYGPPTGHYKLSSDVAIESLYAFEHTHSPMRGVLRAGTQYDLNFTKPGVAYVSFHSALEISALARATSGTLPGSTDPFPPNRGKPSAPPESPHR